MSVQTEETQLGSLWPFAELILFVWNARKEMRAFITEEELCVCGRQRRRRRRKIFALLLRSHYRRHHHHLKAGL